MTRKRIFLTALCLVCLEVGARTLADELKLKKR
jgi:hypothetical protein